MQPSFPSDHPSRFLPDPVVGREQEPAAAARLVADAEPQPARLIFEGAAGIGKTTIWAEAVRRAAGPCLVLAARPTQAEAQLAFAA